MIFVFTYVGLWCILFPLHFKLIDSIVVSIGIISISLLADQFYQAIKK